ncbi:MAG: hypothetical protein AB7N54_00030 [Alphaproteobacteria bacterium]
MSRVEVSLAYQWAHLGHVSLVDGKLVFPKAPSLPGLYRFDFQRQVERSFYVGEADQLSRRFQHYRTPGPSQRTNIRLNAFMRGVLADGGTASVAIVTDEIVIEMAGITGTVEMSHKSDRVLLEHAGLYEAKLSGASPLNL